LGIEEGRSDSPRDKRHFVRIDGIEIEVRVDPSLAPSALRAFAGTTPLDIEVDTLPLPSKPLWLRICVRLLRWYRRTRSPRISQRCVFDPSCSRYSELAFRRRGFFKGVSATLGRLIRCRPGAGGVDIP
jgi:uncharacterized protein